jgi:phosphoglycerol transferase
MTTIAGSAHRFKAPVAYAAALIAGGMIVAWGLSLVRLSDDHPIKDFGVPFDLGEDSNFSQVQLKGLLENGWFVANPSLGAPFEMNTADFPQSHGLFMVIRKGMGVFLHDWVHVHNGYVLLSFGLVILSSLFVLRQLRVSYAAAVVGSLLYVFLPFHWKRFNDIDLAGYYTVPLIIMVIVWIYLDEGIFFGASANQPRRRLGRPSWKALAGIGACILIASGGVYYAFFACFFLLAAGVSARLNYGRWRPLAKASILVAIVVSTLLVNLIPNLIYIQRHGVNPMAVQRSPGDAETFGLKIAQMVLPVTNHRLQMLRDLKEKYNRYAPLVSVDENEAASLGIVGTVGFLLLLGRIAFVRRPRALAPLDGMCFLNFAGLLLATVGGIGSVFAVLGATWIRAYCRIVVFIAFFALSGLLFLLDQWAWNRLRAIPGRLVYIGVLTLLLVTGLLDQTPGGQHRSADGLTYREIPINYTDIDRAFRADELFIRQIEERLPFKATVYQLPYVPFPEYGRLQGMPDYDHFRGYLHSKNLRWSYGNVKGREEDAWQMQVSTAPAEQMVRQLAFAGFSGIYVDRNGYADRAEAIENALRGIVQVEPLVSANQRFSFFSMLEFNERLRQQYSAEEWQSRHDATLTPVLGVFGKGFMEASISAEGAVSHGCGESGELYLVNRSKESRTARLTMSLASNSAEASRLAISGDLFATQIAIRDQDTQFSQTVKVPPGRHKLRFTSEAKRIPLPNDPRDIRFQVTNLRIEETSGS